MKKAMAKHLLRLSAAVFILFGAMLVTSTRADAQGLDVTIGQGQNLNWVSSAEAMSLLDAQLISMGNDLKNFTPGTAPYNNLLNYITYYKLIYTGIEDGTTVQQSATTNISVVRTYNSNKEGQALSDATLLQLWNSATGLLTF
ncbi:MAG: hypothetical protein JNK89_10080 [Saprospiraceae bacterium]|nr:hypothetical protein [Saprospiraceae bacterium]